jgi:hypothetical protein
MPNFQQKWFSATMGLGLLAGIAGCDSAAGTGAIIGGAAGAGTGAIIGHNSHDRTASGALIGGAVGAIGGALVGNEIDKNNRREEYDRRGDYYDDRYDHRGHYEIRRYEDPDGRIRDHRVWVPD